MDTIRCFNCGKFIDAKYHADYCRCTNSAGDQDHDLPELDERARALVWEQNRE